MHDTVVKFSVVVPLYNKAGYVESTLASVLTQTCQDFEIIVVDDGSRDDGPARVAAMAATAGGRIRLFRQTNAGVSAARNFGIEQAAGEWVVFLDADDHWMPEMLDTLRGLAQAHPTIDMLGTGLIMVPDGDPFWSHSQGTSASPSASPDKPAGAGTTLIEDLPSAWLKKQPLSTGSVAVRKTLLDRLQPCFPVGESVGEDIDLWFRLNAHSAVAVTDRPLFVYRLAAQGGLLSTHQLREDAPFLQRMEARARAAAAQPWLRRSLQHFVDQTRVTLARAALSDAHRPQAMTLLWRSRRLWRSPRWWLTVVMTLFWPKSAVARFQRAQAERTRTRLPA